MKQAWKLSGILLAVTGILHTLVAIPMGWSDFVAMWNEGVINTAEASLSHSLAFWFLAMGVALILAGFTLHSYIRKTQTPPPRWLGWWMLGLSAVGCAVVPVSGFWLFLPQAAIILWRR
jgi:hypothetical protein